MSISGKSDFLIEPCDTSIALEVRYLSGMKITNNKRAMSVSMLI